MEMKPIRGLQSFQDDGEGARVRNDRGVRVCHGCHVATALHLAPISPTSVAYLRACDQDNPDGTKAHPRPQQPPERNDAPSPNSQIQLLNSPECSFPQFHSLNSSPSIPQIGSEYDPQSELQPCCLCMHMHVLPLCQLPFLITPLAPLLPLPTMTFHLVALPLPLGPPQ